MSPRHPNPDPTDPPIWSEAPTEVIAPPLVTVPEAPTVEMPTRPAANLWTSCDHVRTVWAREGLPPWGPIGWMIVNTWHDVDTTGSDHDS